MATATPKLSEIARNLGAPRTAGSIDPTDAAEIPKPVDRDRAAGAQDAFAGRAGSPLAVLVIGLAEDLDAIAPIVGLLRDGLAGTQDDQVDLKDSVFAALTRNKKRVGELAMQVEQLKRDVELLQAANAASSRALDGLSTVQH